MEIFPNWYYILNEAISIIAASLIAFSLGEFVTNRKHKKELRLDLIRRLLSHAHEMSDSTKIEIWTAVNEIKFHYHNNSHIMQMLDYIHEIKEGRDVQLVNIITEICRLEKVKLSNKQIDQVLKLENPNPTP